VEDVLKYSPINFASGFADSASMRGLQFGPALGSISVFKKGPEQSIQAFLVPGDSNVKNEGNDFGES
jgi:hypothetical protein